VSVVAGYHAGSEGGSGTAAALLYPQPVEMDADATPHPSSSPSTEADGNDWTFSRAAVARMAVLDATARVTQTSLLPASLNAHTRCALARQLGTEACLHDGFCGCEDKRDPSSPLRVRVSASTLCMALMCPCVCRAVARLPRVWFKISDRGIGIAAEDMARIVEPFQQADNSITRRYGGSGLGLAICRDLVRVLGGELVFASAPGQGSIFVVCLPCPAGPAPHTHDAALPPIAPDRANIAVPQAISAPVSAPMPAPALEPVSVPVPVPVPVSVPVPETVSVPGLGRWGDGDADQTSASPPRSDPRAAAAAPDDAIVPVPRGLPPSHEPSRALGPRHALPLAGPPTVLVVDDNPINLKVLRRQLQQLGISCNEAQNGREAVDLLKRLCGGVPADAVSAAPVAPRLIFMDLHMPVMDGLEATRAIRQLERASGWPSPIPIVAVSADDPAAMEARCLEVGMQRYLRKPVVLTQLRATLDTFVGAAPRP
jgi:CheY-like chemotaxis protein